MREKRPVRSARPAEKPRYKSKDEVLGRIVGECAGEVSMCWDPKPHTQVFQSTEARDAVDRALKEIDERFVMVLRTDNPKNLVGG